MKLNILKINNLKLIGVPSYLESSVTNLTQHLTATSILIERTTQQMKLNYSYPRYRTVFDRVFIFHL